MTVEMCQRVYVRAEDVATMNQLMYNATIHLVG